MTDDRAQPIRFTPLGLESRPETTVVADSPLIGVDFMAGGSQVQTGFGGIIDVVVVDSDGHIYLLELKPDRTPQEIVAHALDFGSWTQSLTLDQVGAL